MPPPPPPPAPPPAPGPPPPPTIKSSGGKKSSGGAQDRGALLSAIHKGKALKKVQTNDRSAPTVGGKYINKSRECVSVQSCHWPLILPNALIVMALLSQYFNIRWRKFKQLIELVQH